MLEEDELHLPKRDFGIEFTSSSYTFSEGGKAKHFERAVILRWFYFDVLLTLVESRSPNLGRSWTESVIAT